MPLDWMDVTNLSFNTLLLLERVQISWLPEWMPEDKMGIALKTNPVVAWYLRHKCPQVSEWVDRVISNAKPFTEPDEVRQAERDILSAMNDLVVYALDPPVYDCQPFLGWDSRELLSLADFNGKTVIDVGAGTGRLALTVAPQARAVFAVEPVENLRRHLKAKATALGLRNVFPADGLITDIPFPDQFADICLAGHVFGENPQAEYLELARVTRPGGMLILCPGNTDRDNDTHVFLTARGFLWSRFEEPHDGWKRKYWLKLEGL